MWHLAADFIGNSAAMGDRWPLWFVAFWVVPLTAYRILMTWLYARAESLPVAQLMHASYTGWLITLSPAMQVEDAMLWQAVLAVSLWSS